MNSTTEATHNAATVVTNAIAEISGIAAEQILPGQSILEDLNIDSLDFVRLIQIIEERLTITITDEQAAEVQTVAQLFTLAANAAR